MLFKVALRNIALHRWRTLVVGSIIALGTVLVIVGASLIDAVDAGMERSIVDSVAGHFQVYSGDAKDDLALFGEPGGSRPDLDEVADVATLLEAAEAVDEVEAVIPMGQDTSFLYVAAPLDRQLGALRQAVNDGQDARYPALIERTRFMLDGLAEDLEATKAVAADESMDPEDDAALARARSDAFWESFAAAPIEALEFLDQKVAPLATQGDTQFLRYLGTDPVAFSEAFELFEVVKGEPLPVGERGIVLNDQFYERQLKHKTARRLDRIKERMANEETTLADDESLQTWVKRNVKQARRVVMDLDAAEVGVVVAGLQDALGTEEADPTALVEQLLETDDANFQRHYDVFYEVVAPHLALYAVPIGGAMTVSAFTRTGYQKSVNLKVWGTFQFASLEKSALAGGHNIVDLVTFRQLYGFRTAAQDAELEALQATSGVEDVARDDAEDALFGGGDDDEDYDGLVDTTDDSGFDEFAGVELAGRRAEAKAAEQEGYDPAALSRGPILHAAVFVKDPTPERVSAAQQALVAAASERGLTIQTVGWTEAAGIVGQFLALIRMVIYIAVFIIFLVALVIINNSMVMATMERVREVGTLRAIGARRGFVLRMFVLETLVLGLLFGLIGGIAGSGIVAWLGTAGIPATEDVLYFLFAGARLYPALSFDHIYPAFIIVVTVSLLSTFYPALLATRISPRVALQERD